MKLSTETKEQMKNFTVEDYQHVTALLISERDIAVKEATAHMEDATYWVKRFAKVAEERKKFQNITSTQGQEIRKLKLRVAELEAKLTQPKETEKDFLTLFDATREFPEPKKTVGIIGVELLGLKNIGEGQHLGDEGWYIWCENMGAGFWQPVINQPVWWFYIPENATE